MLVRLLKQFELKYMFTNNISCDREPFCRKIVVGQQIKFRK